jgi:hypothetical protein
MRLASLAMRPVQPAETANDGIGVLGVRPVCDPSVDCVARCRAVEIVEGIVALQRIARNFVLRSTRAVLWPTG